MGRLAPVHSNGPVLARVTLVLALWTECSASTHARSHSLVTITDYERSRGRGRRRTLTVDRPHCDKEKQCTP